MNAVINKLDNSCELVSINAKDTRKGIGSKLIKRVESIAKEMKVKKIWLVTTNDNYEAAIFYIKKGYRLVKVHDILPALKSGVSRLSEDDISVSIHPRNKLRGVLEICYKNFHNL